jgi:ubiquitin carboxyl-terminal hydrolase 16/45
MAKKYDQYDDYMQQDAHELLRHLLDSMEMEEKDVIKKIQPGQTMQTGKKEKGKGGLDGISPMPSPLASPAPSVPGSPTKEHFGDLATARPNGVDHGHGVLREIPENERLVPFVDVLFGGSLASIIICENCKSVSLLNPAELTT